MNARYPFLKLETINRPYLDEIKNAVRRVVESGYYIGGPEVAGLESDLCRLTGAEYAVGVSNGLDALRLIFRAYIELGVMRPGDEVIIPANTYIASILAVTDNNLVPVWVEPDLNTYNLDSSLIEAAVTPRTRAIMPVHLYGRVCWDSALADTARKYGLKIVEDNAQAIGAIAGCDGLYGSRVTGALGHAGAFSFYPTKNVGALGDAGAVVTHDRQLAEAIAALRNYGSDRQYHNIYAGLNCRLDPIQAAIIRVKLPYLDQENAYRRSLARIYDTEITNPLVSLPVFDETAQSVWHQYVVRTDDRDGFRSYLLRNGVETAVHYPTPPHHQPCFMPAYGNLRLPLSERIAKEVVSLPITRCTSAEDAHRIASIINGYRTSEQR